MVNDAALAQAIQKIRKLRLIDHLPIKDSPPPAITFLAVMKSGLGGSFEDGAIEYVFRHFLKYYEAAQHSRNPRAPLSVRSFGTEATMKQQLNTVMK